MEGRKEFFETLLEHFPNEEKALESFLELVTSVTSKFDMVIGGLKLLPLSVAWFICKSGMINDEGLYSVKFMYSKA